MALKDQPYIPLYVKDVLTDEKLIECNAAAQGVYFRLMCVLHKQERYGCFLLKQKHKQSVKKVENFASALVKPLAFSLSEIIHGLTELIDEKVLYIKGDYLCQKRMINDCELSEIRAKSGSKGGKETQKKKKKFAKAKTQASSVNESVVGNVSDNVINKESIIFPFDTPEFLHAWGQWKEYKSKEFGFKYKSIQSEQGTLTKLSKLANTPEQATAIIMQSISEGWKGLFQIKTNGQQTAREGHARTVEILRNEGFIS